MSERLKAKFEVHRVKDGTTPDFCIVITDRDPHAPAMLRYYASLVGMGAPQFALDLHAAANAIESGDHAALRAVCSNMDQSRKDLA
jgi:hypothetical protein